MNEFGKHIGIFHIWDNPGYTTDQIREWLARGHALESLQGLGQPQVVKNILMASQKLAMSNAVYPNIDHLVITSQTGIPSDSETSYSGVLYETDLSEEFTRSGNENPFIVGWNVLDDGANGSWGSFILVDSGGNMINRALAGVTKTSGTGKLVVFTGTVTS